MKILKQFLLISTISLFTLGFIFENDANAQEVAPALPTMVSADPFYWAEGGFGIDILRSFEMPLDSYLTPGVTSDSSNQEILDRYFEANPDLIAEVIVPEEQRAKNYVVTFFDGDFAQGITVTSFSKFIAPDVFSDSLEFQLQGLPSKDKEIFYNHIHDWFSRGITLGKFSTLIDVVSPDDTVLQTWEFKKCKITDYVILQQDSKLVVSFRQEFIPEYREQISLSCEGFFLHTEQKTNQVSLESSLPTKEDSVQTFIVRFHEGKIQEPTTFTTFSKFSHLSTVELELPVGKISIPMPGGTFEGKPQFILESLPSKDKEKLYQFVHNWLTQVTSLEPIDVDVEFVTGDGTIIQTWEYTECDLLDFQIFSEDNLVSYRFTGKLPTELRDISHFECNGLDFNTEQGPSELKSVPVNALDLIPDDASRAQIYVVKFFEGKIAEPRVFTTFSKFIHVAPTLENTQQPFLSRDRPQFTLESLPSSDKAELYQAVNNWLTQKTAPSPVDVQIEAITGDGTVLLTYEYKDCDIITYEPYLNDNFLAYKFTGEFKMEIRDKTSFDCSGYNINPEQRKSSYIIESSNNFQTFLPENSQRAQAYLVTFSSGYFERDKTFTTFSKFTPSDIFDGEQVTFTLESLTSKDKKIVYDEVTRWRTQNTFLKPFEAKVDVLLGDGTILQRWHYTECGITDFKGFIVDDLLRMKHTYGMLPELRDKTYFNCKGFSLNVDQQKSSIVNSFETIIPEELVSSKEDRAQGFFVTASGGPLPEAISTAEFAKFIPINEGESGIPLPGSTFYGSKDLILSGLPTKNKVNGYAAIETWMKEQAFDPFDVHVGVISGDGTLLQNWAYVDCDFENYVTFLYHSIIFTTYSMAFRELQLGLWPATEKDRGIVYVLSWLYFVHSNTHSA